MAYNQSIPGELVSLDQMVLPTLGFVAQMTGILTKQRYQFSMVYVDQATRLGYVYLQKTASAEETLEGKEAFERYSMSHGVHLRNIMPIMEYYVHTSG